MSKIICDVCGTSYPETATQCPICGCVRPGDVIAVSGDTVEPEASASGTYTYVKGGRFSKANVKKRNQGVPAPILIEQPDESVPSEPQKGLGLVITVIALLLAIVAVVVFIALRFFDLGSASVNNPVIGTTTEDTTNGTTESTILQVPCTEILVSKTVVEFDKAGAAMLLNVSTTPADTTDEIIFASADENVATVSADGKVVAVGGGQTTITISCGSAETQCRVVCNIENTVEETTTTATVSPDKLKLNREDFTLNYKGETWTLYTGEIPADQITWTTDDEKVATIKDGIVTAVGSGYTSVHGEYGGNKVSCIVRCSPAVGKATAASVTPETTAATENG